MIEPTNGRIVWFTPAPGSNIAQHDPAQKLAAMVCHVDNPRSVSLVIVASDGTQHTRTGVQLLQDDDQPAPAEGGHGDYAEWMPYQKGQAAKAAAEVLNGATAST